MGNLRVEGGWTTAVTSGSDATNEVKGLFNRFREGVEFKSRPGSPPARAFAADQLRQLGVRENIDELRDVASDKVQPFDVAVFGKPADHYAVVEKVDGQKVYTVEVDGTGKTARHFYQKDEVTGFKASFGRGDVDNGAIPTPLATQGNAEEPTARAVGRGTVNRPVGSSTLSPASFFRPSEPELSNFLASLFSGSSTEPSLQKMFPYASREDLKGLSDAISGNGRFGLLVVDERPELLRSGLRDPSSISQLSQISPVAIGRLQSGPQRIVDGARKQLDTGWVKPTTTMSYVDQLDAQLKKFVPPPQIPPAF